ncbi:alpha-glucan family phosphorylase [Microvirga sp. TS319]|uniref:alpha-glucan family phosphorylase n=1 Tax=Microvirga sp. TS319 TaxID=3241165 RepID=UPI00351A62FC
MSAIEPYLPHTRIAYLSMEIALRSEMHTYSGGLGVLAGDAVRSAADLSLPMVFVTLASRQGYLGQEIDAKGWQIDHADAWEPEDWATPLPDVMAATIEGRDVWVRPWLYEWTSSRGHKVPVILLDTHSDRNDLPDRGITHRLYGGDETYRLKQEIILGIGGEQALRSLGFAIDIYHLNEGHAALLPLALLKREAQTATTGDHDVEAVRRRCVFTTHTPVEVGHDRFDYENVTRILGDFIDADPLKALAGEDRLNMTRLALNLSDYVNGVSARHAETTRSMFPGYRIHAVTNGVHPGQWTHPAFARLFCRISPDWDVQPETLAGAVHLSDDDVWSAHLDAKDELIALVRERTGRHFGHDLPIIGFARRMTGYKRAGMLFSQWDRLTDIFRRHPFQIVMSGKAHPHDEGGRELIHDIVRRAHHAEIPVAFIPGYDLDIAKRIVAGSDIWLNTPQPPLEASGTSGMKAAFNGVLNVSTLDGWWPEGCDEGVTGWGIGPEGDYAEHAQVLYEKLERSILPLYAEDRPGWIRMMRQAIAGIGPVFNTQRMMETYAREAYRLR